MATEPTYKYTLKYGRPSNSKNLIVGDSSSEKMTKFPLSISHVKSGDVFCLKFDSYSDNINPCLFIENDVTGIANFKSNNNFFIAIIPDSFYTKSGVVSEYTGNIELLLRNNDIDRKLSYTNAMLVKGETPLPWENNLGFEEKTIGEIRRFISSNNLIVGDSSEYSGYMMLDSLSLTPYCVVISPIEVKLGEKITLSFDYNFQDTTFVALENEQLNPISDDGMITFNGNQTGHYSHTFICNKNGIIKYIYCYGYENVSMSKVMLVRGDKELPWVNNITGNDVLEYSLSPIYKNDEKVWEEEEIIPYIIVCDKKYDKMWNNDAKVLIHPKFFYKHFEVGEHKTTEDSVVEQFRQDIEDKWSSFGELFPSNGNWIYMENPSGGNSFELYIYGKKYYYHSDFVPEYENGYLKFKCYIDYD